jgi:hypothetical protein
MKVRFFSLLAALIVIVAGFCIYLVVNHDKLTSNEETPSVTVTPAPTVTPQPSVTPVPDDYESDPGLYPAGQLIDGTMTYGYINSEGVFKIDPSFDSAGDFHDGIACVHMDGQYLAIDTTGTILYYSNNPIADFHNGAAVVSRNSGEDTIYGYINTEGTEIIKPLYKFAGDFGADHTAYVYNGNGKYAQIDQNGRSLNTYELDSKYSPTFLGDGYIVYRTSKELYGVLNLQGEEIFPAKYVDILYMGSDLFALKKQNGDYYGMIQEIPYALFTAKGEQLTDYTLFDLTGFYNGYASVTDSTSTYFIGKDGKEATSLPKYEGRGTVKLFGDVVKAQIDHDLIYSKADNTTIWQSDSTQTLKDGVTVKGVKFKSNRYVLVYYPQIEGLADATVQQQINTKLKDIFTAQRTKIKESDRYSVDDSFKATILKNLLIIQRDGYDYGFGAAHGNPIMDFYYIDTTTGTFYQLKDLFLEGSNYMTVINDIITADIAASEKGMYSDGGFTGITEDQYFILTQDTLTIYFYPYAIAPYAAGFPQFKIPLANLYDYINFQGAFWGSFN